MYYAFFIGYTKTVIIPKFKFTQTYLMDPLFPHIALFTYDSLREFNTFLLRTTCIGP